MKKLVIMRGLPGSGKSYEAVKMRDHRGMLGTVCSADDYFTKDGVYVYNQDESYIAHAKCQAEVASLMADGEALVIVDNTNIKRQWFQVYLELAKVFGYEVEFKLPDYKLAYKGEKVWDVDYLAYNNKHGVHLEVIQRMAQEFEW